MTLIDDANEVLRAKGYAERDLAAFPTPMGADRAILKGGKLLSPVSDDAETVQRLVRHGVPAAADVQGRLRRAQLGAQLGGSLPLVDRRAVGRGVLVDDELARAAA